MMRRAALFLMACVLSMSSVLFNNSIMVNVQAEEIEQVEDSTEDVITEETLLADEDSGDGEGSEENQIEEIELYLGEITTLNYSIEKDAEIAFEWLSEDEDIVACIKNSTADNGDTIEYTCTVQGKAEGVAKVQIKDQKTGDIHKEFNVEVSAYNYSVCPKEEFEIVLEAAKDQDYDFKIDGANVSAEWSFTEVDNSKEDAVYTTKYKVGVAKSGKWDLTATGREDNIVREYKVEVGHIWNEEETVDKPATCTEDGESSKHCSRCDTPSEKHKTVIKALGHKFGDWKIVTEATYTKEGLKERVCSVCNEKESEKIPVKEKGVSVEYQTHVQTFGWQEWKENGTMSGTSGQSKRLEGIKIRLANNEKYDGDIEYRTHVQTYGWQGYVKNGALSGTSGESKRLEAIQIRLTGDMAKNYDIYYRVHAQSYGWLGWAKNDEIAGTAGYAKRLEAIEICLVEKGGKAPESDGKDPYKHPFIKYQTHVQKYGWQGYVQDGAMSGTQGESKRLEGIRISLTNQEYNGDVQYRTHVQTYGWEKDFKKNGEMSGTSGESKRLEAIEIKLTGEMAEKYDIYYRVHAQKFGWMGWAKNGESAGTAGYSYRLEGIEIQLVSKGGKAPGSTVNAFNDKNKK